ncbi:MAG: ATP-dependent DNA helicase RecG [Gammaproteobacteria bacterium]|nr:ATP-dependent DNA helicase RecG [Gammaproteobacteria bacterium]
MDGLSARTTPGTALARPVTDLKGIGPKAAGRCARLGIVLVRDLLFHLPLRYQDRTRLVPIGALRPGAEAAFEGTVELTQVQFGRRRNLLSRVSDGTGAITLRLFHFTAAQQRNLARGTRLRCFGEVRSGPAGMEMVHPEYERLAPDVVTPVEQALTPVYPTTEGLHQLTLRRLTDQALSLLASETLADDGLEDWLPVDVLAGERLPTLRAALAFVHRPPPDAAVTEILAGRHPAQRRLALDELLAHHLSLRRARLNARDRHAPILRENPLPERLRANLPYALTDAQKRVFSEILADLGTPTPMLRLLQGDVGSGKTVVAALTALTAIGSGCQAAIMAPTELLAEQHLRTFSRWLAPLGVPVHWLSGRLAKSERARTLATIRETPAALVVGTHALFQEGVEFARLGVVIIDEQHRFGVHQRLALRDKGRGEHGQPHQLVMTATPIPRTLAMTAYAELDVSVIDALPPGRQPVATAVIPDSRREEIVTRIGEATRSGRQIYWVCTLIDESEALQCQAATETAAALAASLPGVRVGLVHGRMKDTDKDTVMGDFATGAIDLLVATTVIEVGVDVPNASLMIIDNAERLGLAQLHQLRGRVGRGNQASDCVLMYRAPLGPLARERLAIMRGTTDGFVIAQRDLELRGPGELLGTRQAGVAALRIADLVRDADLVEAVARVSDELLANAPDRAEALVNRWLGHALDYAEV